jgi:hypothetical protein
MKFATVSKSLVLGLALLLASSAFAATKGSMQLSSTAVLNGTKLTAGEYKVQWEGSGPNVEVSILKGKNVVAKTQARVVELQAASTNDAALLHQGEDGASALTGLRFEGKKFALELGESSNSMQANGSSK